MKQIALAIGFASLFVVAACGHREAVTADYCVVPLPDQVAVDTAATPFRLSPSTVIVADDSAAQSDARLFAGYISTLTGFSPKIVDRAPSDDYIRLATGCGTPDAYTISVATDSIVVCGGSNAGTFYGLQTLRKAIPGKGDRDILYPVGTVSATPRFAYRGAHFDTSRHFFSADSVKIFIDMMAMHGMNRFHWHITDDQGWRLEVDSLPRLTEVGSTRPNTVVGWNTADYDSVPVSGYYTHEQIRDIVAYAAERHITIIPEIDLPGHMQAALAAYPDLGCTGGPYEVWRRWGVSDDVLCAGNDSVYAFLDRVMDAVTDLFPSEYIHIGGDECPKTRWEKCPKCQAKIRALGLRDDRNSTAEQKLQSHVMKHVADHLAAKGRKAIGWDEILEGGCDTSTVIMSWRGVRGGITAAKAGHDAIMTPATYLYFDYKQSYDEGEPGAYYAKPLLLETVYSYEPIPEEFSDAEAAHIIGVQGNTWCEYIPTFRHAQYMTLPRFGALAELQWVSSPKDYAAFMQRLGRLRAIYDAEGYNYNAKAFEASKEE